MSRILRIVSAVLTVCALAGGANAQSVATSTLSGVVVDTAGGVIPGATVVVKNDATGVSNTVVTNESGAFSVPSIPGGTYVVTVTLSGFKTASIKNVTVATATVVTLPKIALEVGQLSEVVDVRGGSPLVQTQVPTVSSTISTDQINSLPNSTRNALNFVTFLPGVDTTTTNRASTVMGLPQSTINITLDGASVQDNYLKSTDGFFTRVTPRPDAIEQVTVTTAGASASAAGQGAVQIAFQTRSGTNRYTGSAYEYYRDAALNTNYYFNKQNGLGKNEITLHQYGVREGGPIVLPGYDGHNKAFFFFNHEEFYQPTSISRARVVMTDDARNGVYGYNITGGVQKVNVLALAAANGQLATMDPTVAGQLAKIADITAKAGTFTSRSEPNTVNWNYQFPSKRHEHQPTVSADYNLSQAHRLKFTYTHQSISSDPDILNSEEPRFPGFANTGAQSSTRVSGSATMRSTFTPVFVNEATVSGSWGPTEFSPQIAASQFTDFKGFCVVLPDIGSDLTDLCTDASPQFRTAPSLNIGDTVNWLKRNHSVQFGGTFTRIGLSLTDQVRVPTVNFNTDSTNDPASTMFTTANFPGASNTQLNAARAYYATLTGRVSAINSTARLDENTGKYVYGGEATQRGHLDEYGIFVQDSWRAKPTLTLNGGLRYELQMPFNSGNSLYSIAQLSDICGASGTGTGTLGRHCNLFMPGTLTGSAPMFTQYQAGSPGYHTDYNNLAPNVGVAWRPNVKSGVLHAMLGDPEQATIRAGYSVTYNRNGMADFTGIYGANPGITASANRNVNNGNLIPAGGSWPLLFRTGPLDPPAICPANAVSVACYPESRTYPFASTRSNNINIFDPDLQVSYSRSYTIGFQREMTRDMAIEVRYVGTRNYAGWTTENWNETNITTNGFLDEFKLAQANLQANIASGHGNSFAYFGPGTGTAPLPIYLAYLTGTPRAQAGDVTKYAGSAASLFTNTTLTGRLGVYAPAPNTAAGTDLDGDAARRALAIAAGVPSNFFRLNPDAGNANVSTGITRSRGATAPRSTPSSCRGSWTAAPTASTTR